MNALVLALSNIMAGTGLSGVQSSIINNWIGPIFIVGVAVFAVMFIKDRAWMKLIGFVGIAAVVGVLVFSGSSFFGANGSLKKTAENAGKQVNTVSVVDQVPGSSVIR